jgi:hypothetical protein
MKGKTDAHTHLHPADAGGPLRAAEGSRAGAQHRPTRECKRRLLPAGSGCRSRGLLPGRRRGARALARRRIGGSRPGGPGRRRRPARDPRRPRPGRRRPARARPGWKRAAHARLRPDLLGAQVGLAARCPWPGGRARRHGGRPRSCSRGGDGLPRRARRVPAPRPKRDRAGGGRRAGAASFTHRTSRAGDPALHSHVLVANMAQDHEGRYTTPELLATERGCWKGR